MKAIRELQHSGKSIVTLVLDEENKKLCVLKKLQGIHDIYFQLKQIKHPYLPQVLSVQTENGQTVVLEEYIDGSSLAELKLTEKQSVSMTLELCEVLVILHARGIIHRDVKPENILLAPDGHIRLIDFDAAREEKPQADSDTRLLGTRGYAAPEQYGFAQTDARTDIYSAGVTFRRLLGKNAEKFIYRHILRKCTEFAPERRYKTAIQLQRAIRYRNARAAAPWAILAAILLTVGGFLWWTHENAAVITQARYPDEPLLFYATQGDYIIENFGDLRTQGLQKQLEVDLDGDGVKEQIFLCSDTNSDICAEVTGGVPVQNGNCAGKELVNWMLFDIPDVQDYLTGADLGHSWNISDSNYIQITCLDLDEYERNGKEVIISIGDMEGATVSAVYAYTGDTDLLKYCGFMWGNGSIRRTYTDAFESELLQNPYEATNTYVYSGGTVEPVTVVDHSKYEIAVNGQLTLKEWHNEFASLN